MRNIISDVSTLSTIPENIIEKLVDKTIYCVSDALIEDLEAENDITELDIGIGILYIKHIGNEVAYKFKPSDEFSKAVNSTIKTRQNLLTNTLESTLIIRFLNVYKDIC